MTLFTRDAAPLGHPYWWDDVTWPPLDAALPEQVDILVIGAGYTGLSAAIAAADAGARVAVIEAGVPGQGASTRNGGMVGGHPRLSWDELAQQYGADLADALFAEAGRALGWVQNFIRDEGIDCDYQETGRLQLAFTDAHFANQQRLAPHLIKKGGVDVRLVERAAMQDEIVTPLYKGGLVFPTHAGVHPAKYFLGYLNGALRRGIPVVANCPAEAIEREGAGYRVTISLGEVRADKIILATNGYTNRPFQWFASRVFPVPSYLIATEPLSPNLIGELAPGRRMMVETRARHSYFRVSPDGSRILFGGRAALVGIDLAKAARRLHRTMSEIWPELEATKISHVWTGNTGYSFGHIPHVGEKDGLHFSLAYCGSGTVLAPYLGRKAALQAVGSAEGETPYSKTRFAPRWFHPFARPHFMRAANFWYRSYVDIREASAAQR